MFWSILLYGCAACAVKKLMAEPLKRLRCRQEDAWNKLVDKMKNVMIIKTMRNSVEILYLQNTKTLFYKISKFCRETRR